LPTFVSNFLSNRKFNVRVGPYLSDTYKQEMGVPKGSVLSVTLFVIKINNIVNCLPAGVRGSLFVDDFLICYRSKNMHCIERVLQGCVKKIELWADNNGFQFSKLKTVCMQFCNKRAHHPEPSLRLCNTEISAGHLQQQTYSQTSHCKSEKEVPESNEPATCGRTYGLGSRQHESAETLPVCGEIEIRLLMCCLWISKGFLPGKPWPGSECRTECMFGSFRTTPVSSLHMEANELPLRLRSQKLALQYTVKLKSNPGNPAYSSVFQPNYTALFDAKPNIAPTLGLRLRQALSECGVNLNCLAQRSIPSTPPWLFRTPGFNYTLYNVGTKSNTSPDLYHSVYMKLVSENYEGYNKIFTDGSKQGNCVAAAAVSHNKVLVKRLPNHASILSAEAIAALLALDCLVLLLERIEILRTLSLLKSWNVYTSSNMLIEESHLCGFPAT
jgi:Reverse transcriptase (RNA-dependent DNA polymerase)